MRSTPRRVKTDFFRWGRMMPAGARGACVA
jgi:hypothetical protein